MAGITLNKLVFDLKNTYAGGIQSDDLNISDRQVAYWIAQIRALLIRQEFSNRGKIHDSWIQHFKMDFEKVDPSVDPGCAPSCDETIYRSVLPIPSTIQRGHNNGILAVLSIDRTTHYSETSFHRASWHSQSKYTANKGRWYIQGDYLYIIGEKPSKLQVSALLEDPEQIPLCDGECFNWDSNYPITFELAGRLSDMVLKRLMSLYQVPNDTVNNAVNEKIEQ
jgi:hypothetical protein